MLFLQKTLGTLLLSRRIPDGELSMSFPDEYGFRSDRISPFRTALLNCDSLSEPQDTRRQAGSIVFRSSMFSGPAEFRLFGQPS